MLRADRLIEAVRGHKNSVMYLGTALALAGAGSATAATVGAAATPRPVAPVITKDSASAPSHPTTRAAAGAGRQGSTRLDVSGRPTAHKAPRRSTAEHAAARATHATHPQATHATHADTHHPATHATRPATHATTHPQATHATTHPQATHATTHPQATHATHTDTHHPATHATRPTTHATTHPQATHATHTDTRHPATHATRPATHATTHPQATHAHASRHAAAHPAASIVTWAEISAKLNREANPAAARHGETPPADKLLPVATSGHQSSMPINSAQYANATAIVRQALAKRMGVRSAVVAVATAMQESRLLNIDYGTSDSLGLFQQQPDCGWGTAAQVTNPTYASDAFLNALQRYQAGNPSWSTQPLYQAAQGVQNSAFPFAYAQWESQAAQLVQSIVMRLG